MIAEPNLLSFVWLVVGVFLGWWGDRWINGPRA